MSERRSAGCAVQGNGVQGNGGGTGVRRTRIAALLVIRL